MRRQSISLTKPKDELLKAQNDYIRLKLERAEKSGFTAESKAEILKQSKSLLSE